MNNLSDHPKFLMQVNREQPLPKLVSINQLPSERSNITPNKKQSFSKTSYKDKSLDIKFNNKNLTNNSFYKNKQQPSLTGDQLDKSQSYYPNQSQINYVTNNFTSSNGEDVQPSYNQNKQPQPSTYYSTLRKQLPITQPRNYRLEVIQLQKLLQIQKQQKLQLQQIIKQLTVQSQKLKQVNQHIVQRLKQLEKNFVQQKINQQKQQDQRVRKAVNQVYLDVQGFIRTQIETLTNKLKGEKMTPLLQKKLQLFMQSMLQINQNTVQMLKMSKKRNSMGSNPLSQFISNRTLIQNRTNDKQNYIFSNQHNNNRLNIFIDNKDLNTSEIFNKSLNKNKMTSSPSPKSGRRLINNAYITSSNRRNSPSRLLFQTSHKNQSFPHQYSTILKQLQNNQTYNQQLFRTNQIEQSPQKSHIQLNISKAFNTNSLQTKSRIRRSFNQGSESFGQRKKYYETSNYEDKNFHIKQYTPNKRKKIFTNDSKTKSISKRN